MTQIEVKLLEVIKKIKITQPTTHLQTPEYYVAKIINELKVSDRAYLEAIKSFWDNECWVYPVVYFKKIITNKQLELNKHKSMEGRALGDIPSQIA